MKQRIITAVIAAAVFLPIVMYGQLPFTILLYIMAGVGLYELMKMRGIPAFSLPFIAGLAVTWLIMLPSDVMDGSIVTKTDVLLLGIVILLMYTVITKNKFNFDDAGFAVISTVYVAMGFYYIMETREIGLAYVFFVLFTLWATDSGAYFIGKAFGKTKLWPDISPNKTIEGAVGGIMAGLLVALVFFFAQTMDESIIKLLAMAAVIAIFGQMGDLVQSAFKRHYGVKDSGKILPGHGGVLDRTDSWLFVFPILHLIHFL